MTTHASPSRWFNRPNPHGPFTAHEVKTLQLGLPKRWRGHAYLPVMPRWELHAFYLMLIVFLASFATPYETYLRLPMAIVFAVVVKNHFRAWHLARRLNAVADIERRGHEGASL